MSGSGNNLNTDEKFFAVLESIKDGYYEVDIEGNLTLYNDALCKILGYTGQELSGLNYRMTADPAYIETIMQTFKSAYRTGVKTKSYEWHLIRKGGAKIYVEASVSVITDNEGNKTGFRGILRDITGRKLTEEKLRRSEEAYRLLVENASDIIYVNDWKGNFKYMNESGLKKLGYTKEEIGKLNYVELLPEGYKSSEYEFYKNQYDSSIGETYREIPVIKKDGTIIWFAVIVQLITDENGSVEFNSIARDITELKHVQLNLEESERKYRELIEEKTKDIIITTDLDGRILTANKNLTKKLGYIERDFREMNIRGLIYDDPDDNDNINLVAFVEQFEKVTLNGTQDVRFKTICRHRFLGEPVTLQFKIDPVFENGDICGLMGFISEPSDDPLRDYITSSSSSYTIPNSLTIAEEISFRLTRDLSRHTAPPVPAHARIGLREIIVNAIEHGNLEITYDEKTEAQAENRFIDLIRERQNSVNGKTRKLHISYSINSDRAEYHIRDEGPGFNCIEFIEGEVMKVNEDFLLHGRGIKLALGVFDEVKYNDTGNEATLVLKFHQKKNLPA